MGLKIYTDGATSNNGSVNPAGGWGIVAVDENDTIVMEKFDGRLNVTNNYCELMAIIEACEWAAESEGHHTIYSDSAYCMNCYKDKWYKKWQVNGWINSKKQPVVNKWLWEKLIPYFEDERFNFEKVKGHAGNRYNERADELAVMGRQFIWR